MVFPYNAIAGKDRVLFDTYDSIPDVQQVSVSFYGSNSGFHGYLGGVEYVYLRQTGLGELSWSLRNIFTSFYGGVAASDGNFDFRLDLGTLTNIFGEVVTPAPLSTPVGNVVIGIGMFGLVMQYYSGGVPAAFPANATLHLNIGFVRNTASRITVAGSGVSV